MPSSTISPWVEYGDVVILPISNLFGALFHVQGRCDSSETYSFTVSDTNGWEVEQSEFEMIFEPMEDKVITINVTIPTNAQNGTANSITLTMTSTSYPEISGRRISPGHDQK